MCLCQCHISTALNINSKIYCGTQREMFWKQFNLFTVSFIFHSSLASWFPSPAFVDTPTNITTREGAHAFLPCGVANLGDRSVTWMRKKNLHIISAGILTYSPDNRYRVLHPSNTNEWTLHIRHVSKSDKGIYECQVNSDPKITRAVFLRVQDKNVEDPFYELEFDSVSNDTVIDIVGPTERYIQAGSILGITCTIDHEANRGPQYVRWFHGGKRLNYSSPRGGLSLQIDKTSERTVSKFFMSDVKPADSGRYTCSPATGGFASITVHVQSGHHEAAVQQSGYSAQRDSSLCLKMMMLLLLKLNHIQKYIL